jgi:hypothetical protein
MRQKQEEPLRKLRHISKTPNCLFVWNLDMIRGTLFLSFAFVDNRHALSTSKRLWKSKSFIKLAINHIYIYIYIYMMSGVILIVFDDFPIYK